MKLDYDVIVVGSGPAGITSAIYLKRANINVCIMEKSAPGGQLNKSSTIENYPGFEKITGPELAYNFYEQILKLDIPFINEEVIKIEDKTSYKIVETNKKTYTCKGIILALGRKPRSFDNKNVSLLEGKGVSYCSLCDGPLFKNQDVSIIGGGNSALEESLYLADICKSVTIINRRDVLRGDKMLVDKVLKKDNINILYNSEVVEFNKQDDFLESLLINTNGKLNKLDVKACFIFIGYVPATDFLSNLDILDEKGYIKTDKNLKTDIPFIYACGDTINKQVYQIVTATGEGAVSAISFINDYNS
ncbi:MAG: FAD-dependent oxidoreductase [Tenericutes bacterium]|nr:FAD-dependent oxidoreductase [Mycoplasmatota bacterium]